MKAIELAQQINQWLEPHKVKDYCPNGLQLENSGKAIRKIALAVSATLEVITKAKEINAQALIVHHGLFWDHEGVKGIQGTQYQKIKELIQGDIALFAYHLPLDFHHQLGNNIQLAQALGLFDIQGILEEPGYPQGVMGRVQDWSFAELKEKLTKLLGREPLGIQAGPTQIQQIALVTGGGQKYFTSALACGAQAFITGEASEFIYGEAQENQAHFFAAGHYATEQFGIQALGNKICAQGQLECVFIPTENPI